MNNTIDIVPGQWRAQWNGQQYSLERFDPGGKMVYSPHHQDEVETRPKWVNYECYSTDLSTLVEKVVKHEVSEQAKDLRQFLKLTRKYKAQLRGLLE